MVGTRVVGRARRRVGVTRVLYVEVLIFSAEGKYYSNKRILLKLLRAFEEREFRGIGRDVDTREFNGEETARSSGQW